MKCSNSVFFLKGIHTSIILALSLFVNFTSNLQAQSHTFATFSPGTITSGTSGVSTALTTGGISGNYLFYVVTADFVGTGGSPAFSNTMELEISNGGSTVFKDVSTADVGTLNNSSSTSLTWTGLLNQEYTGGGSLTARFHDNYNTGGPYTSSVTNVTITIYQATSPNTFATFSPGTVTSGTSGVSTSLSTGGLSGDYLFFVVTADFVGTGGSPAFSNTMNLELNDNSSITFKDQSTANTGALNNSSSTSLTWTGILKQPYTGGGNLTALFYDSYNTGGPFTSSVTNVTITIYQATSGNTFSTYSPGTVTSGTSGVTTALSAGGLSEDYLFYVVTADYVGSGGSPAFSNTMELEISDGGSTIYKDLSTANSGTLNNSSSTSLTWVGMFDQEYTGGGSLSARFYDNYNTGGPFTSNVTNVSISIYESTITLPITLLNFEAGYNLSDNVVELAWKTANELNNASFTVERSSDGNLWDEITIIPGKGTYSGISSYSAIDLNPEKGINYYRLKQTDFDGGFTHSSIRTITSPGRSFISVFPNPTSDVFYISLKEAPNIQAHHLRVTDRSGKTVFHTTTTQSSVKVDLTDQPAGVYFIRLDTGEAFSILKE